MKLILIAVLLVVAAIVLAPVVGWFLMIAFGILGNYFPAFVGLSYGSSIMIGIALEIASFPASFFKLVKEFLVDD